MKPSKIRVMCPDCGRAKMRFETEKEAERFIKWNGDEINTHGEPLRVYWCPACCGYHITHKAYRESYGTRTDRLLKAYELSQSAKNKKVGKAKEINETCVMWLCKAGWDMVRNKKALRKWLNAEVEDKRIVALATDMAAKLRHKELNGIKDELIDRIKNEEHGNS